MSLCCSFSLQGAASACVILIVQLRGRNNKHKVLIKLAPAEESRPPELLLQAGGFERKANQASGVRGQRSVLVDQDLPDDEVAALGFSQEGLQFHGGLIALLRLAVLIT